MFHIELFIRVLLCVSIRGRRLEFHSGLDKIDKFSYILGGFKNHQRIFMFKKSVSEFKLERYKEGSEGFKEREEARANIEVGKGYKEVKDAKERIKELEKKYDQGGYLTGLEVKQLEELRNDEAPLDEKQMQMFLNDILDNLHIPGLKKFIEEHCIFDLQKNKLEGVCVDTATVPGKFVIILNPQAFYEYGQTEIIDKYGVKKKLRYFNPEKVARLIGQSLGYILAEPEDWHKHAPKIDGGKFASWQEFAGFCLAHPDEAERLFPPGYKYFRQVLSESGSKKSLEALDQKKKAGKKESLKEGSFFYDLRDMQEKGEGPFGGLSAKAGAWARFINNLKRQYHLQVADLWNTTDWYQRAIAEYDDKEVSRINTRNESIGDREKALRIIMNNGKSTIGWYDQCRLRTLMLADAKTSDWLQLRQHVFLQATDQLYRDTNGEQISGGSYDFLMRVNRVSETQGKRYGTKHSEYQKVLIGDPYLDQETRTMKTADRVMYVRKDYEQWLEEASLYEIGNKTNREVSGMMAQETYEYCKIGGKKGIRFIEIEECWGDEGYGNEKYAGPTGDFEKNLGDSFVREMLANMNHRQGMRKLGPDQIAVIARLVAEELKQENQEKIKGWGLKVQKAVISGSEHVKPIMVEIYNNYRNQFMASPKYLTYINYFLNKDGVQTDADGVISRYARGELTDEKIIDDFSDREFETNPEYKKAHRLLDEYDDEQQDSTARWEKEGDKWADNSENGLRRKFVFERETKESAQDIEILKGTIEKYRKLITDRVRKSSFPAHAQNVLIASLLDRTSSDADPRVFIREELEEELQEKCPDLFVNKKITLDTDRNLTELVNSLRPYRKEYCRLAKLLEAIGINDYAEIVKTRLNPNVTSRETKLASLPEEERKDFEKQLEEIDQAQKSIEEAKDGENKDKAEKKKEGLEVKLDQKIPPVWLEKYLLKKLTSLFSEITKKKEIKEEIKYEWVIEKLETLGFVVKKDSEGKGNYLPETEIARFTDPDKKIHTDQLLEILQMINLAIQLKVNEFTPKPKKEDNKEKSKKDKDKADEEKQEQDDYSD